jgi:acyl-CoA synthetase (AMP-forming)/AMP-acid ligase II
VPQTEVETQLVDGPSANEGRLLVRTPGSMSGYYRASPEAAARVHDGWYDTGDILRVDDDGFFYVVGRADDMIITGGENIYPASVELLLERHPAVLAAAVVGVADERRGQVPIAFVVARPGVHIDPDDVKAFMLTNGPAYAHPRRIEVLAALPLTPSGKVDKRALAARGTAAVEATPIP